MAAPEKIKGFPKKAALRQPLSAASLHLTEIREHVIFAWLLTRKTDLFFYKKSNRRFIEWLY
jgi:hypothetical protein